MIGILVRIYISLKNRFSKCCWFVRSFSLLFINKIKWNIENFIYLVVDRLLFVNSGLLENWYEGRLEKS